MHYYYVNLQQHKRCNRTIFYSHLQWKNELIYELKAEMSCLFLKFDKVIIS
jgi:hypothetical protein